MTDPRHAQNRLAWNEAAAHYEQAIETDIAFLRDGGKNFCPPEFPFLENLGSWCQRAIHLQCAGGRDTLSLLNCGAKEVVGVDISDRMIACAQAKSAALGAPATWYRCDILETPAELNGTADLVYTGRGALCWIMDLSSWAQVVARLLKPGGKLYIFDGHPFEWVFDLEADHYRLDSTYGDYFSDPILDASGWPESYIPATARPESGYSAKWESQHTFASILNPLAAAGLRFVQLGEHPDRYWSAFPNMPEALLDKLPHTFSLVMEK